MDGLFLLYSPNILGGAKRGGLAPLLMAGPKL
jgi:hypothetical protein